MEPAVLLLVLLALVLGAAGGYLAAHLRAASARERALAQAAHLTAQVDSLQRERTTAEHTFSERLAEGERRQARSLAEAEERHAKELDRALAVHAEAVEQLRADAAARLAEVRGDHKRLVDEFDALSKRALAANTESFLREAEERFKRTSTEQAAELAKREEAVKTLVAPLEKTLAQVREEVTTAERARLEAHASLTQQVKGMQESSEQLRTETTALVTALRAPQVRGQWGEMQLRRTVEAAGMVEHVSFEEQVQLEGGKLRPDLVVTLPDGKQIVVDSKVAFNGYLEAMEARDEKTRANRLAAHARHMRTHIEQLASKEYWSHLEATPEFTVMFVPSEVFLDAALQQDPTLQEFAFSKNVVPATPATLVALLRTVAYTWRQEKLATEAKRVFEVGRDLHKRFSVFGKHLTTTANRLNSTVEAFNSMTSSLDSRVVPALQRFTTLQGLEDLPAVPPPLEISARPAYKADLFEDGDGATEPARTMLPNEPMPALPGAPAPALEADLTAALAEQQAVFGDRTQPEDDLLAELDNGRDTAPLHREHA